MQTVAKKTKRPKAQRRRYTSRKNCDICACHGSETFRFLRRQFIFDVDKARQFAGDGRPAWEMHRSDVRYAVDTSHIHEHHVPHVTVRYPGIVARVRCTLKNGKVVEGEVLIDGHHRAAKYLRLKRAFYAYRLTVAESDAILIKRPDAKRKPTVNRATRAKGKKST